MSSSKRSSSASGGSKDRAGGGPSAAEKAAAARAKEEAAKAKEELVKAMPDPAKTDLLAQALLREYMHRKGFKKTLASFDKENPRTETTINSRELMNTLLSTRFIQERNAQRTDPLATIMEVLCSYRLRKRTLRRDRGSEDGTAERASASKPYTLVGPNDDAFDSSDEEGELKRMADEHVKSIAERRRANKEAEEAHKAAVAEAERQAAAAAASSSSGGGKKDKKEKKKSSKKDADGDDDDNGSGKKKKKDKKDKKKSGSNNGSANSSVTEAPLAARGRGFDPLGISKPLGGGGASSSGGLSAGKGFDPFGGSSSVGLKGPNSAAGGVGSKWMPGGLPSSPPSIGVSKDTTGLFDLKPRGKDDDDDDYKPPSFVAGSGFKLSTDNSTKVGSLAATDVWGGGITLKSHGSGSNQDKHGFGLSPARGREGSSDREDIPSPYANLGNVKYDSGATAKSVLVSSGSYGTSSGGGVGFNLSGSGSMGGGGGGGGGRSGRRITWGNEGGDGGGSAGSSPVSTGPTRVGFGFNNAGSPGSPAGSGRARRSVTIIGE